MGEDVMDNAGIAVNTGYYDDNDDDDMEEDTVSQTTGAPQYQELQSVIHALVQSRQVIQPQPPTQVIPEVEQLITLLNTEFTDVYKEWYSCPGVEGDGNPDEEERRRRVMMTRYLDLWGLTDMSSRHDMHTRFKAFMDKIQHHEEITGRTMRMWLESGHLWTTPELKEAQTLCACMSKKLRKLFYYMRRMVHDYISTMEIVGKVPFRSNVFPDGQLYMDQFMARDAEQLPKSDIRLSLVTELLEQFQMKGYRRKKDSEYIYEEVVYRNRVTGKSVRTFCYQPTSTIEDVIYRDIQMDTRAELFAAITHRNIVDDMINIFRKHHFVDFPFLEEEACCFSFTDGIWDAEKDVFCYYDQVPTVFPSLCQGKVTYNFIETSFAPVYWRNPPRPVRLNRRRTRTVTNNDDIMETPYAGNATFTSPQARPLTPFTGMSGMDPRPSPPFVEQDDNREEQTQEDEPLEPLRWQDIKNVMFEKIFKDQGWGDQAINLRYAMMGRTLWRSGTKDNWQCVLIDIGESGTGKSTAQKVWQKIFPFQDVMIFGDNQERSFSRDKIAKSRIYLAPDMRGDSFGITPEFFLTLATNDAAVLPRKHRDPLYVQKLDTPGMLATNELPKSYRNDVRGSIFRRLCPFGYNVENLVRDPTLGERIVEMELAGILRKAAVSYMSNQVFPRDQDLMTSYAFPPEVQLERNKIERSSNSLLDFLMSPEVVRLEENESTEVGVVVEAYGQFCRSHRQHKPCTWNEDFYARPFRIMGLVLQSDDNGDHYIRGVRVLPKESASL